MAGGLRESEAFHKLCPVEIKRALEEDGAESLQIVRESQGKLESGRQKMKVES